MQVEANAEPAAQAVSDQALRPAAAAVKENAQPAAKQVTDGALRPAGQAVSDNAVPMTRSAMRDQVFSSEYPATCFLDDCPGYHPMGEKNSWISAAMTEKNSADVADGACSQGGCIPGGACSKGGHRRRNPPCWRLRC